MERTTISVCDADISYNSDGLVPVIAQDHTNGDILMLAWMNSEALERTLRTGNMTYWSRSRKSFWVKGETSGNRQRLIGMSVDCDRDCLLAQVEQLGPACHEGQRSCFFTGLDLT